MFRPVTPADKDRLQAGLALLSPESRYLRFFAPVTRLSEEELRYFTHVDQVNHVAWGALKAAEPEFPGLGVGRFVRLADAPEIAEAAVTVIDSYQRQGLGTILASLLYLIAGEVGVRTLRGAILPENRFLIEWLHALGASTRFEEGLIRVEMPVVQDVSALPVSPVSDSFRNVLEQVRSALYGQSSPDG